MASQGDKDRKMEKIDSHKRLEHKGVTDELNTGTYVTVITSRDIMYACFQNLYLVEPMT